MPPESLGSFPRHQPQNVTRSREAIRVALVYKNFAASRGISHIGLGVAALNTQRVLRDAGIWSEIWPCNTVQNVLDRLEAAQGSAAARGLHPVSHVVISAPWISTLEMQSMLTRYPDVDFAVVSHSNVGFLMADPNGIKLLREDVDLAIGYHNFKIAGNCRKFCNAWDGAYGSSMVFLPNLYDLSTIREVGLRVPWQRGQILKIGVFGATRPLKNMPTSIAAAIMVGRSMRVDTEIWVSSGRDEGGGTVKGAVTQLIAGLDHVKLVETGWRSWPQFRQVVSEMSVLLQPSYTESYNMVTADGIAEGVSSVVSDAIDWVPLDWIANADVVSDIARVARRLLHDDQAVNDGQAALRRYVKHGLHSWEKYLLGCRDEAAKN